MGRLDRTVGRRGEGRCFTDWPGLPEDFRPIPRPLFGLHEVRPTYNHPKTTYKSVGWFELFWFKVFGKILQGT